MGRWGFRVEQPANPLRLTPVQCHMPTFGNVAARRDGAAQARARHRLLRVVSTALVTAGLVVLADVGITLAWAEPISALRAALAQHRAAQQLDDLRTRFAVSARDFRRGRLPVMARRLERRAKPGHAIGEIEIDSIHLDAIVVEGTDTGSLERGPGHYPDTALPGQHGTVGIAGHRTTYLAPFRDIDDIARGDEIALEMPYARFTYRFERSRIVDPSDVGVVRDVGESRLVLTACHPLYSAAERYVVFARLVRVGPP